MQTDWDAVQKDMKSVSVDSVKRRLQYAKKAFSAANVKGTVGCTPAQSGGPSGGIEKKSPGKVNRESQKLDRNIPRKTGSAIPLLSKKSRRKMAAAEVKLEDVDEFSDDWS